MRKQLLSFVQSIPGWLTKHEGMLLEILAKEQSALGGVIVEIGSYCGKSTIWLAQSGERVYAVDPHKGNVSGGKTKPTLKAFKKNIAKAGADNVIAVVKMSKAAARNWNQPIKLLFIDGLHDEKNARQDFTLWNRFVVEGGIVAMHDAFCGWPGAGIVARKYIVNSPEFRSIGIVGSIIFGIKGKPSLLDTINLIRMRAGIALSFRFLLITRWFTRVWTS